LQGFFVPIVSRETFPHTRAHTHDSNGMPSGLTQATPYAIHIARQR